MIRPEPRSPLIQQLAYPLFQIWMTKPFFRSMMVVLLVEFFEVIPKSTGRLLLSSSGVDGYSFGEVESQVKF